MIEDMVLAFDKLTDWTSCCLAFDKRQLLLHSTFWAVEGAKLVQPVARSIGMLQRTLARSSLTLGRLRPPPICTAANTAPELPPARQVAAGIALCARPASTPPKGPVRRTL